MMKTYRLRQYLEEIYALKEIYNDMSATAGEARDAEEERNSMIRAEVAKQQLIRAINQARRAVVEIEDEHHA